ncbi:HpcH/HpaI aldolase/citrate lyase family protein [Actinomadura kijaniata]|uniref:HpcH/HpaI aldolase/citrate lyase family protein n=1 Tax=Actinomadura kijaniata TaxID=46161 RepID=UPI000836729A|nr:CoA ester lyase [Actinomadura kijaniata]
MRSALYVPGDAPGKLATAPRRDADELIVDLEDAVPLAAKAAARRTVADWLATRPRGPRVWVRVNPGERGHDDVRAVALPGLTGVCVAKAETVGELAALDALLTGLERERGLRRLGVVPLLESAAAVLDAPALARAPRVVRLQLGEADLRADLGVEPGPDERELLYARSRIVLASAAARIEPPIAPVSTDVRDLAALRDSTRALKRLGFRGRACVHPAQLPVVNEVFTPTPDELARARDLLARHEAATAGGTGVCLDDDGRLVDEAVVRSARRLLAD